MKISFSGTLLRFVDFNKNVEVEAQTISEAFEKIIDMYPDSSDVIYGDDGTVRQVHQIFLNGNQVNREEFSQSVKPEDRLDIMTAIAGG